MSQKIDRLEALLKNHIQEAANYIDTNIAPSRVDAYEYYYGQRPVAKNGQPPIVKNVVFEKIQQALPQIKEPFISGRDVVKFIPYNTQDSYGSCIASAVVNKIIKVDNDIDKVYDQAILDGLLLKSGTVKVYWEDGYEYYEESFENLSQQALDIVLSDDDVELIEKEEVEPPFVLQQLVTLVPPEVFLQAYPAGIQQLSQKATDWASLKKELPMFADDIENIRSAGITYSGTLERKHDCSTVRIRNVAPENFLIDENASSIEDAVFSCERSTVTVAELMAMGFPEAAAKRAAEGGDEYSDLGDVTTMRNSIDNTTTNNYQPSIDKSMNTVALYECYVHTALVDNSAENSFGKRAKLYQMYYCNGVLLDYNEVDRVPFFTWCPITLAHKFFGMSLAETLFEQQDAATYALRGALQYLAFSTNPRMKAIQGAEYNLAAFQANLPGSVVPITKGDLIPFEMPRLDSSLFSLLGTIGQDSDAKSGVSDLSVGLNADALKSNVAASTVALQMDASTRRLKQYAKNFAHQCVKPMYAYVYELYRKNAENNIIVQVNGRDVEVDPQSLPVRKNLDVEYSLGRNDQIDHAVSLLQTRDRIMNNPQLAKFHTPQMAFQLESDIMKYQGIYDSTRYLQNPGTAQIQPTVVEQQQLQLQQQNQQITLLAEQNKQIDLQVKQQELALKERQLELEALKVQAMIEIERMKLEHKQRVDADEQNRKDAELEFKQEVAADKQVLAEQTVEIDALKTQAEIELEAQQKRGVDIA